VTTKKREDEVKTIDITPKFNQERVQAYAEAHSTTDPTSDIGARLEVLGQIADFAEELGFDTHTTHQNVLEALLEEIQTQREILSTELISWFQTGPPKAAR
jgi:hypothetical protein